METGREAYAVTQPKRDSRTEPASIQTVEGGNPLVRKQLKRTDGPAPGSTAEGQHLLRGGPAGTETVQRLSRCPPIRSHWAKIQYQTSTRLARDGFQAEQAPMAPCEGGAAAPVPLQS